MQFFMLGVVLATGCLIIDEPSPEERTIEGEVHRCAIATEHTEPQVVDICFGSTGDIFQWAFETWSGCVAKNQPCDVQCSTVPINQCLLVCPNTATDNECNASHGCYCK